MNNLSPFRKWMVANKFFTRDKTYTHLLLNGGKINIPECENKKFLKYYSQDIENSNPNFICEVRTDVFKFYIDLDFLYVNEISDNEIIFYTYNIQRILDYLIDNSSTNKNISKCVVCLSQPSTKKNLIKMGVHLMFPNLLVNKETALGKCSGYHTTLEEPARQLGPRSHRRKSSYLAAPASPDRS